MMHMFNGYNKKKEEKEIRTQEQKMLRMLKNHETSIFTINQHFIFNSGGYNQKYVKN